MRDPAELYELSPEGPVIPPGLPLIVGLTGFADAGSAVSQFGDYILESLQTELVAKFDTDELLDYRARRPIVLFEHDHLTEYNPATLRLFLVWDEMHSPFLLLTGFEPDFKWERFVQALIDLIARYQVSLTCWLHAIPMPVPHTRPISVTVSGNQAELIEALSVWKPTTQVPANVVQLLEYRLYQQEAPVVGYALLIPHYLADTEFPTAALTAMDCVSTATGLIFPTDHLREAGREFVTKIDEQVANNEELARLVGALEERHDTYMEGTALRSPLTDEDGELPTADEIAAELEKFLATKRHRDGDPPTA
ncbi:proteasome assembly chaperone family protein [Homoserinimonas sp. OAct 916]|uniref:proteasome assembly chaperone family protein n=1 Tax=Homoserinimonas sp. OAct 916 TaxID=2211450 RepID=UPI000DBE30AD|nr:PAC2 family protein [Homoserinimonas sp. OAct 916]